MSESEAPYTMGRTQAEYERLRSQARIWEASTRRLLQQAGLPGGMNVLDVGSGPGEIVRLMAEIVGAEGAATGMDVDGELGRVSLRAMEPSVAAQVRFIEGNIESMS